jgi:putative nucleotidyltransferase with HDIG domain
MSKDFGVTREEAVKLVNEYAEERSKQHMLFVEGAMREIAKHLGEDEEAWGLAGLLHDIDYDIVTEKEKEHCGEKTQEILEKAGVNEKYIYDIRAHNDFQNLKRETKLAKALYAVDGLTGIIFAASLVRPDKDLQQVKVKSVKKKLKDKRFAANVNRDTIRTCESELDIELDKFIELALEGMKKVRI